MTYSGIKENSFSFLLNDSNTVDLPEKKIVDLNDNKEHVISKGHFIVWYEKETSIDSIQKLVLCLAKSVNEYKENVAHEWFGKTLNELEPENKQLINSYFENRIEFINHIPSFKIPPPPKSNINEIDLNEKTLKLELEQDLE